MQVRLETEAISKFGTFDTQMLGITEDQIKTVDASESEVVSRVLMSRIRDIVVTFRPDGIIFNTTSVRSMIDVIYVQMSIDRGKHRLYVEPSGEFDRNAYRWCNEKEGKRTSRKITGRPFGDRIYKMMNWSKGYSFRVNGYPSIQEGTEDEYLLAFDLDEFDQTLLTERGLIAAGVDDSDLGDDAEKIHADIAEEKAKKEKAREEAKASGKKKRTKKKTKYYGAVEDGAFGTLKKDHVNRIVVPLLEQREILGSINDMSTELQYSGGEKP